MNKYVGATSSFDCSITGETSFAKRSNESALTAGLFDGAGGCTGAKEVLPSTNRATFVGLPQLFKDAWNISCGVDSDLFDNELVSRELKLLPASSKL